MLQRKPRVFLSHSKKDIDFIRKLEFDLRICQCETWIDDVDIRHGKPWLDEIFSSGIPSCEIVLCYITQSSAQSTMVKKEIDTRLVERLANEHVTLLIYVASAELRQELRSDIQTLQIPVLNQENYGEMLPCIISEVWRNYNDSAIAQSIQGEKVRRLEAELRITELEKLTATTPFSSVEQADFGAIWLQLDREFETHVRVTARGSKAVFAEANCIVSLQKLYRHALSTQKIHPFRSSITHKIGADLSKDQRSNGDFFNVECDLPFDYETELLRYGLLRRATRQVVAHDVSIIAAMQQRFELVFTEKFDRFNFWLHYSFGTLDEHESVIVGVN